MQWFECPSPRMEPAPAQPEWDDSDPRFDEREEDYD